MSWQLLVAVSVVALSVSVLLQRVLLHKDKSDPIAYVVVFQALVAVIIALYAVIHGFQMPDISRLWPQMLLTMLLYAAGSIAYAKTLQRVEASIFSILFATSAMWVMLMGVILFREQVGVGQLFGALLVFISVGLLAQRRGQLKLDRGILTGLLTGLLFGFATVSWVWVGRYTDAASWAALSFAGPSLLVLALNPKSVKKMKSFFNKVLLLRMSLLGLVYSISAVTLLLAYQYGKASVIAPLQQASIMVTILLAFIFLHERDRMWHKLVAALVCLAGVILIV